ncbi:MAG: ribonuclease [Thermoleophilaceae bacterium]|nr:ribonuclease [Thermoleophilaceae bacterium]
MSRPPRGPVDPVVCVLTKRGRLVVAEPLFGPGDRISLPGKAQGDGRVGDIVLIGGGKRGARVVRRIGRPNIARDVLEAMMLDKGLRRSFPRRVEEEATEVAAAPRTEDAGRRDLRELPTFTIDPVDARDFDDAISAQREEGGRARVWVHIADVSAFVRPDGVIELEAFRRGTSVYVPGAVEPMLPQALSNDACSLRPHVDRLAVTVEMEMEGAQVRSVAFHRSVIRSDARLDYDQIDDVFAGRQRAEDPWAGPLEVARGVATALNEARRERGSALEVESSEPSFEFDERGDVVAVHHDEQTESHRLIEHLMILANEQVAEFLTERKVPTLYRVHDRPDPRSVEALVAKLESLDVPTPPIVENMTPQQAADAVGAISRLVADYVRRTGRGGAIFPSLVLRALKKAYYSPENLGHAGLASATYCHFTSPIRRYPDLVVHRGLLATLGVDDARPHAAEMDEAGAASSAAERRALKVERGAMDVCFAFLLERRLREDHDQQFDGEITGVIGAGAFVRFGEEGFEGFLPRRRIRGDRFHLNEAETALIGEHTGRAMRLGDPVLVQVDRVEAPRGRVDLYLGHDDA